MDVPGTDNTIDETVSTEAPATEATTATEPTQTIETTETADTTTDTTAPESTQKPEGETADTDTVTEPIIVSELKYGDIDVGVEIPPDLANMLAQEGLDAVELTKEMYSENGLSDETKATLYEKYGKWQVDAYLTGIEAINERNMTQYKADVEKATQAMEDAWTSTMDLMGGEDRWADLDAYAAKNLSEEELAEFNDVMKNGTFRMQQLMIKDLWNKFDSAGKPAAPVKLDLESGDTAPASNAGAAVSQEEYFQSFMNGEYSKDPAGWDARRRAGMEKGI